MKHSTICIGFVFPRGIRRGGMPPWQEEALRLLRYGIRLGRLSALFHDPRIREIKERRCREHRSLADTRRILAFAVLEEGGTAGNGIERALFAVRDGIALEDGDGDAVCEELPNKGIGAWHKRSGEGNKAHHSHSGTWLYLRIPATDIKPCAAPLAGHTRRHCTTLPATGSNQTASTLFSK